MNSSPIPGNLLSRGSVRRVSTLRVCRRARGSALLAALCFATVLTIALGSYLTVCYRTLALSNQSAKGTHSLQLAEAGMEDALWALNKNDWTGWTLNGSTATKQLTGFTFDRGETGKVTLTITNYNGTGNRAIKVQSTVHVDGEADATRTISATSAKTSLFVNAVAATTGTVRFQSGGSVDSYDSSLGTYASQTPSYSAIISSSSPAAGTNTVLLTNAQIKGYVATVDGGPAYSTSGQLLGPSTSSGTKIDSTRISTSPYQPIFSEIAATGVATSLPNHNVKIGTPGATTPQLYYDTNTVLNKKDLITVEGPVILTVSGNLTIEDTAKIQISSTGSLELHVAGDISVGGSGIQNDTALPKKLAIINTTATTGTFNMSTANPLYGVVYLPNHDVTISSSPTIYGALVGKSVTLSAAPTIHYDLALRNATFSGVDAPYGITQWTESND